MIVRDNFSLKTVHTFHTNVSARKAIFINTLEELKDSLLLPEIKQGNYYILGGGSNVLFTKDFEGIILFPQIKGIHVLEEEDTYVVIEAGAGEDWDRFVEYTVNQGWSGIENLSLIPGNVGTSPIQNIGAYGVEVQQVVEAVKAIEINTGREVQFLNRECRFGYRSSIFKYDKKGKYIITSVIFRLSKTFQANIKYGTLSDEIERLGSDSLGNVRQAVINIRNSKLPDPEKLGNAGSFFKNPEIESSLYDKIKVRYPGIPAYPVGEKIKIPAAFLIEQAGWKGYRSGDAGVHIYQPLVLVNYGKATGSEILDLAKQIQHSIYKMFTIDLEMEVNVIP